MSAQAVSAAPATGLMGSYTKCPQILLRLLLREILFHAADVVLSQCSTIPAFTGL